MVSRLGVFATHPIQYQVPMWRDLANRCGLETEVNYFSDHSLKGGVDREFGRAISWDVPLLEGYQHAFVQRDGDTSDFSSLRLSDPIGFLRDHRYDFILVHGYMYRFERQLFRAARRLGIPVLMRGEFTDGRGGNAIKRFARDAYLRWVYRQVWKFGVLGKMAHRHLERFGVSTHRTFSTPYCVDSERFEQQYRDLNRTACREKLGIAQEEFAVLFCGKLVPRKDPLTLMAAVAALPRELRIHLLIVGDGELQLQVARAAQAMTSHRVSLYGFVNQSGLGEYYRAADAFVLPSRFETWGLVTNEAMHFRLPVIVSDKVGCHHDLVREAENGYRFPPGDVAALSQALTKVASDRTHAYALGRMGGERIQEFSTARASEGIWNALHEGRSNLNNGPTAA